MKCPNCIDAFKNGLTLYPLTALLSISKKKLYKIHLTHLLMKRDFYFHTKYIFGTYWESIRKQSSLNTFYCRKFLNHLDRYHFYLLKKCYMKKILQLQNIYLLQMGSICIYLQYSYKNFKISIKAFVLNYPVF